MNLVFITISTTRSNSYKRRKSTA